MERRNFLKTIAGAVLIPTFADIDFIAKQETQTFKPVEIWSEKTLKSRRHLEEFNLRRVISHIQKNVKECIEHENIFINDKITRNQITNSCTHILENLSKYRALNQFHVICNKENNPPNVIEKNILVVDIDIQYTKSVDSISLNFTRSHNGRTV